MAFFLPLLASAAGSAIAGAFGKKGDKSNEFLQNPEYEEAKGARSLLWDKLQKFGEDSNYGAIDQDWADIWQKAQNRVKDYYYGTATAPSGAYAKLASKAARGNMSGSPAYLRNVSKMQVDEGNQYKDLASSQAISEAQFGEDARRDWLGRVEGLSQQKPQGQWSTKTEGSNWADVLGSTLQAGGSAWMQNEQNNSQLDILKQYLNSGDQMSYAPRK